MFTGIIEETGTVTSLVRKSGGIEITVEGKAVLDDLKTGDSVALNGVCLTATAVSPSRFTVFAGEETLRSTTLTAVKTGTKLNLERALAADGRFGGHMVLGHVDGTGAIEDVAREGENYRFSISFPKEMDPHIVMKGSIAVDGISLTISGLKEDSFDVHVIPFTRVHTSVLSWRRGTKVNLETDILGKYVERILTTRAGKKGAREGDGDDDREKKGKQERRKRSNEERIHFFAQHGIDIRTGG